MRAKLLAALRWAGGYVLLAAAVMLAVAGFAAVLGSCTRVFTGG